jgi:hypothetical protein
MYDDDDEEMWEGGSEEEEASNNEAGSEGTGGSEAGGSEVAEKPPPVKRATKRGQLTTAVETLLSWKVSCRASDYTKWQQNGVLALPLILVATVLLQCKHHLFVSLGTALRVLRVPLNPCPCACRLSKAARSSLSRRLTMRATAANV